MFQTKVVEKITTHITSSIILFPRNRAINGMMWNYGRTRKAIDDNKLKHSKDARMKTHTHNN
jgi:hypothetical protein